MVMLLVLASYVHAVVNSPSPPRVLGNSWVGSGRIGLVVEVARVIVEFRLAVKSPSATRD